MRRYRLAAISCGLLVLCLIGQTRSQDNHVGSFDPKLLERLEWRSIGPANMGGRIADVEGVPGDPSIVYVGTASGGLWKTTNGGVNWNPIFERENTISIGDIALEPNNADVIWVGTGESAVRNSVSVGDGVYKSNDGGKTWRHMGLKESEHVSRIVIHPNNPDVVYVGALGHAFGPNEERGVFMTTDGGNSWRKTLYIDPEHGVADLEIDPGNPKILYAAMWQFDRKPWTHRSGSEKGGVFKSIDGGLTWNKLTNNLPKLMGRIGVKVAPSNTNVVYVICESKEGLLYRSDDRGETFRQMSKEARIVSRGFYYTNLRVDPTNENRIYAVASTLFVSIDGGRNFRSITGRTHIDYHALWIDPKNPKRLWQGQDGGIAVSYDGGERWEYVNNIPIGQFYQVSADTRQPFYWVSGGLQDNGGWTGPSRVREPAGIMNDDWRMVNFGDGFHVIAHPDDPDLYLSESQGGNIVRTDMRTREQQSVTPHPQGGGGPAEDKKYRFNWNAPIAVSPHDKNTVFFGGNVVFKSTDFGKSWQAISSDLTTNDKQKQKDAGGPIAFENSTAEYHCTIISLAESPVRAGMVWAGTDDGNLQLTNDGGRSWSNLINNVTGIRANSPVSHVEPSRTSSDVAYVSFDRHMLDDFRAYIFKTTDAGGSWKNIAGNLPEKAYVHVVREDPRNRNLIYAGTEIGLFASYTGGANWVRLNLKNLPNVSVHDILVHPRDNDLILATHGRSIWVFDDASVIQQFGQDVLNSDAHLFDVRPATRHTVRFTRYGIGDKVFTGPNPQYGALISYYLKEKPGEQTVVKIQVLDQTGKVIRDLEQAPKEKGVNRVAWDLRLEGPRSRRPPSDDEAAFFGGPRGPQALPGPYTIRLTVGSKVVEKKVAVVIDPAVQVSSADLQIQFDHLIKLRDMQSSVNSAVRMLESVKEQLQQTDKVIKERLPEAPNELKDAISENLKLLDSQLESLSRRQGGLGLSGRAGIGDRLGSLFGSIDGVNAAPTEPQREYYRELEPQFRQKIADVNRFIDERLVRLNELLRRYNAPTLVVGKPIELLR